jgi:allantoinase
LVHAENPDALRSPAEDVRRHATWLASRPPAAEEEAIGWLIELARVHGGRVHVVHLSAAGALPAIARARESGVPISVETCPHYLVLEAEEIPEGATLCKCAPPIREGANREALWQGLLDGTIDAIVSDHSPSPPEGKRLESGDFVGAWGGIASLGLGLPLVWTELERRAISLEAIALWMCEGPAAIAGLEGKKGRIAEGYDADFTVDVSSLEHRNKITPYHARKLFGSTLRTILRGETIYERGAGFTEKRRGRWVRRA